MLISEYTSKNIKLPQNRQQKSATYFARVLLHDLESMLRVLPSTLNPVLQQITEPVASYVNPKFWSEKITRKSRHTQELHLGTVKCEIQILLQKVKTLFTFCNNFSQPTRTWFVGRQVWFVGGIVKRATSLFNCFCYVEDTRLATP